MFWHFSGPWKKLPEIALNGASRFFFPTNPDIADILGRTDLDFENLYFLDFGGCKFPDFQVPRFPGFQKSGLGQAWAGPGLALGGTGPA